MSRRFFYCFVVVASAAVTIACIEGLRRYITSQFVVGLAKAYGGRVEANAVDVGWSRTRLEQVRFFESDGRHLLFSAARLELGISLPDLVSGRTSPAWIIVDRPEVNVRLDEHGNLLTRPPTAPATESSAMAIYLKNGSVVVQQAREQAKRFGSFDASITSDRDGLHASGELEDPHWGHWDLSGGTAAGFEEGAFQANSKQLDVSPGLLKELPLVPPSVWDQVLITGRARTNLRLGWGKAHDAPTFRAEIELQNSSLGLPALDVTLTELTGHLVIDDSLVQVQRARGKLAGGDIAAQGTIKFAETPVAIDLRLGVKEVRLAEFPASWSLPEETDGKLGGNAELQISLSGAGETKVSGDGRLSIENAVVAGIPSDDIKIALHASRVLGPDATSSNVSGAADLDLHFREAPLPLLLSRLSALPADEVANFGGAISTDLHIEVPLATIRDFSTFEVRGNVRSRHLHWQNIELQQLGAAVSFSQGVLELNDIRTVLSESTTSQRGRATGNIQLDTPRRQADFRLSLEDAPLAILEPWHLVQETLQGSAAANLKGSVPLDRADDLSAWQISGSFALPQLAFDKYLLQRLSAKVHLEDGVLSLADAQVTAADAVLSGSGKVVVQPPYRFTANLHTENADLKRLAQIANNPDLKVAGQISGSTKASGALSPLRLDLSGSGTVEQASFEDYFIDRATFDFSLEDQKVKIQKLDADLLGGHLSATMSGSLAQDSPLSGTVEFQDIQVERLLSAQHVDIETSGSVSGKLQLVGASSEKLQGAGEIHSSKLQVRNVTLEPLTATLRLNDKSVQYVVNTTINHGNVKVNGIAQFDREQLALPRTEGHITLRDLAISRAVALLFPSQHLPLTGTANLEFDYSYQPENRFPTGKGRLEIVDLAWEGRSIAEYVESDANLSEGELHLENLSAPIAGGTLQADIRVELESALRGAFELSLNRVSAKQLLGRWFDVANTIDGRFDARLQGDLGSTVTGGGTISAAQARASGLDISGLRLPVRFRYAPERGRAELHVLEGDFEVAQGRIRGGAEVSWDGGLSLSGKGQVTNVRLQSVASSAGHYGLGAGRISGRFSFSGTRVRSMQDLNAAFDLRLTDLQHQQASLFTVLSRYIVPLTPSTTRFQQGDARGRLANGVLHLQQLSLTGSDSRLRANGSVALAGRLNLDVVAQIGGEPLQRAWIRRVLLRVIEAETLPLTLLVRANQLLADRLFFVHVGGTIRNPVTQIRPVPQLEFEALRFFAYGAAGP